MILDTNALSDFFKKVAALEPIVAAAPMLRVPVIVLGEYRFGIQASAQRPFMEEALRDLLQEVPVLPVEEPTATVYASIRAELKQAGTPIPENDIWIAALARQHRLPLLSRDTHFDQVSGLERLSW